MSDFVSKTQYALADLERHERKIGRKAVLGDKDAYLWLWRLTTTDVLITKWRKPSAPDAAREE